LARQNLPIAASIQCASRIVYAMSRDDWGSMRIAYVHAEGTLMAAPRAIAHGVVRPRPCGDRILYLSKYLLSYVAVLTVRHREPSTPRPY